MVAPTVEGIDLFKIANRSISGWVPSFKMGTVAPVKQPFCRIAGHTSEEVREILASLETVYRELFPQRLQA